MDTALSMDDFWSIIAQFPDIRTFEDLCLKVREIEREYDGVYPAAYRFLSDFEKMIRLRKHEEFNL